MDQPIPTLEEYAVDELEPEKRLWAAVLIRAIYDYFEEKKDDHGPRSEYIKGEYRTMRATPFIFGEETGFEEICEIVGSKDSNLASVVRKFCRETDDIYRPHRGNKRASYDE